MGLLHDEPEPYSETLIQRELSRERVEARRAFRRGEFDDDLVVRCSGGETLGVNARAEDPPVLFAYYPAEARVHVLARFTKTADAVEAIRLLKTAAHPGPLPDRSAP